MKTCESISEHAVKPRLRLIDGSCYIAKSPSREVTLSRTIETICRFVPFQTAGFFNLTNGEISGGFIAQPDGSYAPEVDFANVVASFWNTLQNKHAFGISITSSAEGDTPLETESFGHLKKMQVMMCNLYCSGLHQGVIVISRTPKQKPFSAEEIEAAWTIAHVACTQLADFELRGNSSLRRETEFAREYGLTKQETIVTRCIAHGMVTEEIARKLSISPNTARKHLQNIFRKTGVSSKISLLRLIQQYQ